MLATSDSEELSVAEEIRCFCEVMDGLVSISAVLVFNSVGSNIKTTRLNSHTKK